MEFASDWFLDDSSSEESLSEDELVYSDVEEDNNSGAEQEDVSKYGGGSVDSFSSSSDFSEYSEEEEEKPGSQSTVLNQVSLNSSEDSDSVDESSSKVRGTASNLPSATNVTSNNIITTTKPSTNSVLDSTTNKDVKNMTKSKIRKADVNVVAVSLKTLEDHGELLTGDPVFCSCCGVVFSHLSVIQRKQEEQNMWVCEFCSHANEIHLELEEMPKTDASEYIISVPSSTSNNNNNNNSASMTNHSPSTIVAASKMILFCIDVSGSMNDVDKSGNKPMSCVKSAVNQVILNTAKSAPDAIIGIITFSSVVTIFGDGSTNATIKENLNCFEALYNAGKEFTLSNAVKDSEKKLAQILHNITATGSTALGPGLTITLGIASQCRGTQVIICTDGEANLGIGSLQVSAKAKPAVRQFYENLGAQAAQSGTAVSVITIKGREANMEYLGKLAQLSGGKVNIVNPANLGEQFTELSMAKIIATNTLVQIYLHRGLHFRNESNNTINNNNDTNNPTSNHLVKIASRSLGNVTTDQQATFSFGRDKVYKIPEDLKELPFQVQIKYVSLEGKECIKTITKAIPVTQSKELAEKNVNIDLLINNSAQTAAKRAFNGQYTESRGIGYGHKKFLKRLVNGGAHGKGQEVDEERKKKYGQYKKKMNKMNVRLGNAQRKERERGLDLSEESESDDEEEEQRRVEREKRRKVKADKKMTVRQENRGKEDETAAYLYQMAGTHQ